MTDIVGLFTDVLLFMRNELEATNEEINIHKEQVIEIISKYGFPPEIEILLLEIDELPESNLQSINSGMISNLRHFFFY